MAVFPEDRVLNLFIAAVGHHQPPLLPANRGGFPGSSHLAKMNKLINELLLFFRKNSYFLSFFKHVSISGGFI
jgi:hypothetical protein